MNVGLQYHSAFRAFGAFWLGFLLCSLAVAPSRAEVTRIFIDARAPLSDARKEHAVPRYEEIRGRLIGQIDPRLQRNSLIQDVALAPRNAYGNVEYLATFTLFKPIDPADSARVLLDIIPNRGHRYGADRAYFSRGYSLIWIGWQGDLAEHPDVKISAERLSLESVLVPRARKGDSPIEGRYLVRVPAAGGIGPTGTFMKLDQGNAGGLAYFPASYDSSQATLTGGPAEDVDGRAPRGRYRINSTDWRWWNCTKDAAAGSAVNPADLCIKRVKGQFSASETYELVFTVRNPLILGLGMAATRDAVSFFRREKTDSNGNPNPLAQQIDYVVSQGASQSGNLIKTFIGLGFNQDEQGRIVWDGAGVHIAGRRVPINYRFAIPGSSPTLFMPGSEGILWWGEAVDSIHGGPTRSLLDRCSASRTCPKIFETFGGAELWNQRMTPGLVNFDLRGDIALPSNVRRYYFPGTGHGGGHGGFVLNGTNVLPATPGIHNSGGPARCALQFNPNPETEQMRALTLALVDWVSRQKPPPPSRYPLLAKGELVRDEADDYPFPSIPGVPKPFGLANPVLVYDYGNEFNYADVSGVITKQPPTITGVVPALVAKVDRDGNEKSGVPSVQYMVPLGTYLSWNVAEDDYNAGRSVCAYTGGFVPFAKTRKERLLAEDPRESIEERYGSRQGYLCAVQAATRRARMQGFLLEEDAKRLVNEASAATASGDLSFLPDAVTPDSRTLCHLDL